MDDLAKTLIILGALLLIGLFTDALGRRTKLPRVTLMILFGIIIGPCGFGFITPEIKEWFSTVTDMALVMIGFLLGEKFTITTMRRIGKLVFWISVAEVIGTAVIVLVGLLLLGVNTSIALILAAVSTATDPAATVDVVTETKADGICTRTLLGIVAIDDAWGLIVFSLMLIAEQIINGAGGAIAPLLDGAWEIGGAVLLGTVLGFPMAFITGRIRPGRPTLVEAVGLVFLCGGLAIWLDVSFLLAAMMMGVVVANRASHHERPFHAIENIEWPFMILFFVLSGASLELRDLLLAGVVGTGYIVLRILGRLVGAWLGGLLSNASPNLRRWMGLALLPQAGVALGMALVARQRYPDLGETILPVIIGSTILFELIGPIFTRSALDRWREIPATTPQQQVECNSDKKQP